MSLSPNSAPLETVVAPLTVVLPVTDKLPVIPVVPVTVSVSFKIAFSLTSRPLFSKAQY